jgi:hypothetical protein
MAATGHEHPGTAAYGVALLSRFPVASWQLVRLPQIPMRFRMYLPGAEPGDDRRRRTPGGGYRSAAYPTGHADGGQYAFVLRARLESASAAPTDARLAGLPRSAAAHRRPQHDTRGGAPLVGNAVTGRGCHVLAETPNRQLDHILTDDDRLRSGATEAELMPISDHRPLVADLDRV